MQQFVVRLNADAENDILDSYEWGVHNWGAAEAEEWIRSIYSVLTDRLSSFPRKYPIASDFAESDREIRHLTIDRYRILFEVRETEVIVLHVRGAHIGI